MLEAYHLDATKYPFLCGDVLVLVPEVVLCLRFAQGHHLSEVTLDFPRLNPVQLGLICRATGHQTGAEGTQAVRISLALKEEVQARFLADALPDPGMWQTVLEVRDAQSCPVLANLANFDANVYNGTPPALRGHAH